MQAAEIAGIRAILVHAISDEAKRFGCGYFRTTANCLSNVPFAAK